LLTEIDLSSGSKLILDLLNDGYIASDGSEVIVTFTAPNQAKERWSCSHPHEPHNHGFVFKNLRDDEEQNEST